MRKYIKGSRYQWHIMLHCGLLFGIVKHDICLTVCFGPLMVTYLISQVKKMMLFTWLLTILSLIGVVLNIRRRRECFFVWAGTNASWAIVDFNAGLYAQAALFAVYFATAIWGIWEWRHSRA